MLDQKGFDLWADEYDKAVGLSEEDNTYPFAGYRDVLGSIYREVMAKENASVLDIGFGTGTLTTRLYEGGCKVYGQDFSERMLELAKEKMPDAKLFLGDFSEGLVEPLREQRYDFIIGTYSFHHLNDSQKIVLLKDIMNLLNPDGKIFIGDVAFETRKQMEECKTKAGDEWDDEEFYFVADEIKGFFSNVEFIPMSYCAGILVFRSV